MAVFRGTRESGTDVALRWLLGVVDERGRVQRTNCRVGNQGKNIRIVVVATCNNVKAIRKMKIMSRALYGRFEGGGGVIDFPYPDRDTMELILEQDLVELAARRRTIDGAGSKHHSNLDSICRICVTRAFCLRSCGSAEAGSCVVSFKKIATMPPDDIDELAQKKRNVEGELEKMNRAVNLFSPHAYAVR